MRRFSRAVSVAATAMVTACLGDRLIDGGQDGASTSAAHASSGATSSTSVEPTTEPPDASDDGPIVSVGCAGFICASDTGLEECDIWAQDCPADQKCMPYANDGGGAWNGTRCSPLDPTPAGIGEPCTVVDSGVSGIDDCESAAMCFEVDPETNMGVCWELCSGNEAFPVCRDPASVCHVFDEGVLILCYPICDPFAQDCGEGSACYPVDHVFWCWPDAGGEQGAYGSPCEFPNVCDPGLFCADASTVPGCASSYGCCSDYCDLQAADPDAACTGAAQGQVCLPWFDVGEAPPGFADVGACALPR